MIFKRLTQRTYCDSYSPRICGYSFYGEPEPVLAIIDTLRAQQGIDPADIEIIVSDDVSPTPFPEVEGVTVVRRPVNGGFGKAVNSGVAAATGEWVFILNSDLELDNTFVSRMLAAVERHGEILASPQIIGHDGKQQWVARKFPTAAHVAWEWFTPWLVSSRPTGGTAVLATMLKRAPAPRTRRSTGLWAHAWLFLARPSTASVAWTSVST